MAVDPTNGDILLVGSAGVYRYANGAWDSGINLPFLAGVPQGIAVDLTGDILMVSLTTDLIYRHDGTSWDTGLAVPSAEGTPTGLAVDPANGDILTTGDATNRIYRYSNGAWDAGFEVPVEISTPSGLTVDGYLGFTALWRFDVPQPAVSLVPRTSVNAGPAGWTFTVPEPTVQHTRAPRPPVDFRFTRCRPG